MSYQRKNRQKVNESHKEWRKKNPEKVREYRNKNYLKNKEKLDKYRVDWQREKRRKERLEIIQKYGGKCSCCGESNEVFLAFDHIKGGGTKHIKSLKSKSISLARWIISNNFPDSIQLLCHNCNYAKHREGVCPHKQ